MSKTIKEMYNEEFVDKPDTSLLKHYNSILNKTPDELTIDDVCMLVRQEFFLDICVPKAIEILKQDHSAGDNYDYSLLVNLSNVESSLIEYKEKISDLINVLENDYKSITFELESDEQDYLESIERLKEKIKYKHWAISKHTF